MSLEKEIQAAGKQVARQLIAHPMMAVILNSAMVRHRIPLNNETRERMLDAVIDGLLAVQRERSGG